MSVVVKHRAPTQRRVRMSPESVSNPANSNNKLIPDCSPSLPPLDPVGPASWILDNCYDLSSVNISSLSFILFIFDDTP